MIRDYLHSITPTWGTRHIDGTLAGCPDAALSLAVALHPEDRGELIVALFGAKIPVPAFKAALRSVWQNNHWRLMEAVFNNIQDEPRGPLSARFVAHGRLREMFSYADFSETWQHLPDRFTVYRGTYGVDFEEACGGLSWTLDYDLACWFAVEYSQRYCENPDQIRVIQCEVIKDEDHIWLFTNEREEQEVVIEIPYADERAEEVGDLSEWKARANICSDRMREARLA